MIDRTWVLGLTGGIGSGKTAASDAFARLGVPVIDTDRLARDVVAPGAPALAEIAAAFGAEMLDADGTLDRAKMRERVFGDPVARRRLESITHPRIRQLAHARIEALDAPYCLLVVPLLVEGGMKAMVDRILVVDAPEPLQLARVMARDGVDEPLAQAIIAAQASRTERLACADDVLVNDADRATLEARVAELHARYLTLAREGRFAP